MPRVGQVEFFTPQVAGDGPLFLSTAIATSSCCSRNLNRPYLSCLLKELILVSLLGGFLPGEVRVVRDGDGDLRHVDRHGRGDHVRLVNPPQRNTVDGVRACDKNIDRNRRTQTFRQHHTSVENAHGSLCLHASPVLCGIQERHQRQITNFKASAPALSCLMPYTQKRAGVFRCLKTVPYGPV